jgi:hypothetical protein
MTVAVETAEAAVVAVVAKAVANVAKTIPKRGSTDGDDRTVIPVFCVRTRIIANFMA